VKYNTHHTKILLQFTVGAYRFWHQPLLTTRQDGSSSAGRGYPKIPGVTFCGMIDLSPAIIAPPEAAPIRRK
jgi:hypothetical protein